MEKAKLSKSTFAKILDNESVTLDTIVKICEVLQVPISDVVEIGLSGVRKGSETEKT